MKIVMFVSALFLISVQALAADTVEQAIQERLDSDGYKGSQVVSVQTANSMGVETADATISFQGRTLYKRYIISVDQVDGGYVATHDSLSGF